MERTLPEDHYMTIFYLILGLEVLLVILVSLFLIKKIRGAIKNKKERKRDSF